MITIRIGGDDFVLQERPGKFFTVVAGGGSRGSRGYVCAEVMPVHTHECVARRWGRRNHHKGCNCGAQEAFDAIRYAVDRAGKDIKP